MGKASAAGFDALAKNTTSDQLPFREPVIVTVDQYTGVNQ